MIRLASTKATIYLIGDREADGRLDMNSEREGMELQRLAHASLVSLADRDLLRVEMR